MVEVDNYITHISELNTRDMKLQQEMDQKFIYEEDYNKAYLYLVESAIPNYESLLKDAKEFKITYNDLKEINQLYIKSNELYLESLSDTQNALENGSEELSDLAYDKVIEADNLMVKHDTLLEKLAEENGIELEWE